MMISSCKTYDQYSDSIQLYNFIENGQPNNFLSSFNQIAERTTAFSKYLDSENNEKQLKLNCSTTQEALHDFKIREFNFFKKSNFFKIFKHTSFLLMNLQNTLFQTFQTNNFNIFNQHIQKRLVLSFHTLLVESQEDNDFWVQMIEKNIKENSKLDSDSQILNENPQLKMDFEASVFCCQMFFRYSMLAPVCFLSESFLSRFDQNWNNCFSRLKSFGVQSDFSWQFLFDLYEVCCPIEQYIHGLLTKRNPSFGQMYDKNPMSNNLQCYMFLLYLCMIIKIFKTQAFCAFAMLKSHNYDNYVCLMKNNDNTFFLKKILKYESQSHIQYENLSVSVYDPNNSIRHYPFKQIYNGNALDQQSRDTESSLCSSMENMEMDITQETRVENSQNSSFNYAEIKKQRHKMDAQNEDGVFQKKINAELNYIKNQMNENQNNNLENAKTIDIVKENMDRIHSNIEQIKSKDFVSLKHELSNCSSQLKTLMQKQQNAENGVKTQLINELDKIKRDVKTIIDLRFEGTASQFENKMKKYATQIDDIMDLTTCSLIEFKGRLDQINKQLNDHIDLSNETLSFSNSCTCSNMKKKDFKLDSIMRSSMCLLVILVVFILFCCWIRK